MLKKLAGPFGGAFGREPSDQTESAEHPPIGPANLVT